MLRFEEYVEAQPAKRAPVIIIIIVIIIIVIIIIIITIIINRKEKGMGCSGRKSM